MTSSQDMEIYIINEIALAGALITMSCMILTMV